MSVSRAKDWLFWTPRILGILAILFVSMFALDAFGQGKSFWQGLMDFAIHLVPSYILLAILLVAWKWELIGGALFVIIGLLFTPWIYNHNYAMNHSVTMSLFIVATLTMPFILIGGLFLWGYFRNKKGAK